MTTYRSLIVPLTAEVWLILGGFTILFIILLSIISSYDESEDFTSFGDVFLLTFGTLAQQDFNDKKMFSSRRIACFTLLLLSFTACVYYNAEVLNRLLSPTPNSIRNLEELLNSNMRLGVINSSRTSHSDRNGYLYGHRDEITKRLVERIESEDRFLYKVNDGLDLVRESRFAFFIEEATSMRYIVNKFSDSDICLAYIINRDAFHYALTLRKKSPYKEILSRKFIWMLENGLRKRFIDIWLLKLPKCRWHQEAAKIGVEVLTVAYFTLLIGMVFSTVIFILEIAVSKKYCHIIKK